MTSTAFSEFVDRVVPDYAEAMVKGGEWDANQALHAAQLEIEARLPTGLESVGHDLFSICTINDGMRVGDLWLEYRTEGGQRISVVLYVFIEVFARGHGFARDALLAAEMRAQERGARAMRLTVAGGNRAAFRLYRKLGYKVLNARLGKALEQKHTERNSDLEE